jgi:hypothetical protein
MTKFIAIGLTVIALWVAWVIFQQWENVQSEREAQAQANAPAAVNPRSLPGIPDAMKGTLEDSLVKVQRQGAAGLREWLKAYGQYVEDPRRAWIELDYCVLVARDNPAEARKIFHDVKERTPPFSPVYPRIKQLEKTYE